jgi:uncharacterized membrane protein
MVETFHQLMVIIGFSLDGIGVLIIAIGASLATIHALFNRKEPFVERYQLLRQNLGRAILVGLEFIIAGDIIRTVVVDPTILNVVVLGLIVLIRTFLSIMLHFEVEGHWPWQDHGTIKL